MKYLKTDIMTQPPSPIDWTQIIAIIIPCLTLLFGWLRWMDASFKSKKEEKIKFIEEITEASVNKTLDKVFTDQNNKINTLFEYREADRKHWDDRFDTVIREIKK